MDSGGDWLRQSWKPDREGRTMTEASTVHGCLTTVQFGEATGKRQTDAKATVVAIERRVTLVEHHEILGIASRVMPTPSPLPMIDTILASGAMGQRDPLLSRHVLDRICQKIREHLMQPRRISVHAGVRRLHFNHMIRESSCVTVHCHDLLLHAGNVDRLVLQPGFAGGPSPGVNPANMIEVPGNDLSWARSSRVVAHDVVQHAECTRDRCGRMPQSMAEHRQKSSFARLSP
jgi:hypothetical protein